MVQGDPPTAGKPRRRGIEARGPPAVPAANRGHAGPELRHCTVIEDKCSHTLPVSQTRPEAEQRFSYWPIRFGKKVTSARPEESSRVIKPIIRPLLVRARRAAATVRVKRSWRVGFTGGQVIV
ncbi:MAG TPA: hypothetical protein VMX13_17670 [Sedimentisphaerales bacterium]|nr:hypothetical protein [Sedimentisphaerales bacterium]